MLVANNISRMPRVIDNPRNPNNKTPELVPHSAEIGIEAVDNKKGFFSAIKDWFNSFYRSFFSTAKDSVPVNPKESENKPSCCTNEKLKEKENPKIKLHEAKSSAHDSSSWSTSSSPSSSSSKSSGSCCTGGFCSPRSYSSSSDSSSGYYAGSGSSWYSSSPVKPTTSKPKEQTNKSTEEVPRIKTVEDLNQSLKLPEKTIEKIAEVNSENTNQKLEEAMQQDTKLAETVTEDFGAFLTAQETISKEETQTVPPGSQIAQNSEPESNGNKEDVSAPTPCNDLTKEDLA